MTELSLNKIAFDRIKTLADKKRISLQSLAIAVGLGESYIYNLKSKKSSSSEAITKIADYFNVSTDYIYGRTDNPRIASDVVTAADGREVDLSNLRERVVMFDGKPLSDDDVEKIAQIIKLSLGVTDIENK
ncbi:helix-turn-helix domain-containing protein [Streptococcus parasuis]